MDFIGSIIDLLAGLGGIVVDTIEIGTTVLSGFIESVAVLSVSIPSILALSVTCVIGIRIAMQLI